MNTWIAYALFVLTSYFISESCYAQVKVIKPSYLISIKQTSKGEAQHRAKLEKYYSINERLDTGGVVTEKEKIFYDQCYPEDLVDNYWSVLGPGCSWYCGMGYINVTASSFLVLGNDSSTCSPSNAHDHSFKHAWYSGGNSNSNECLNYSFPRKSSTIETIYIANGFVTDKKKWKEFARVKLLKVYNNGKELGVLELKDSRKKQRFDIKIKIPQPIISPINNREEEFVWNIKFEVLEVYPGKKSQNLAISEIYFDGDHEH